MKSFNIAYYRVSTKEQNIARQQEGIKANGIVVDKEFTDKMSGSFKHRPELENCLNQVREGDTLHVYSIDRLARNLVHLQEIVTLLKSKGVTVRFHKENLTFSGQDNALDNLMLQMLGAFAEYELTMNRSRREEGIEAARLAGKKIGKPGLDYSLAEIAKKYRKEGKGCTEIGRILNLSRNSIYKLLKREN